MCLGLALPPSANLTVMVSVLSATVLVCRSLPGYGWCNTWRSVLRVMISTAVHRRPTEPQSRCIETYVALYRLFAQDLFAVEHCAVFHHCAPVPCACRKPVKEVLSHQLRMMMKTYVARGVDFCLVHARFTR